MAIETASDPNPDPDPDLGSGPGPGPGPGSDPDPDPDQASEAWAPAQLALLELRLLQAWERHTGGGGEGPYEYFGALLGLLTPGASGSTPKPQPNPCDPKLSTSPSTN